MTAKMTTKELVEYFMDTISDYNPLNIEGKTRETLTDEERIQYELVSVILEEIKHDLPKITGEGDYVEH